MDFKFTNAKTKGWEWNFKALLISLGSRDFRDAERLQHKAESMGAELVPVILDVTNDQQIEAAVKCVSIQLEQRKCDLWGLVNCSNVGMKFVLTLVIEHKYFSTQSLKR